MGSFQAGMRMGADAWDSAEEAKRLKVKDARDAEQFEWQKQDRTRATEQRGREDAAWSSYSALNQGIVDGSTADFSGVAPGAALGPVPQDQMAPVQGLAGPDGARAPMVSRAPTRREELDGRRGIAMATRDVKGLQGINTEGRQIGLDDIQGKVMKMTREELEKLPNALNNNQSDYPMLYMGKDKNGYNFVMKAEDGSPGQAIKLNESQLRQLALAHELGAGGYGTEALSALAGAHKQIADHVSKWNDDITKATTTNNQGVHFGKTDQLGRDKLTEDNRTNTAREGIARDQVRATRAASRDKPNYVQLVDKDGNPQMVDVTKLPSNNGQVVIPSGMRWPKQVDPARVQAAAASLVGTPTGTLGPNGKPEKFTALTALDEAERRAYGNAPKGALPEPGAPPPRRTNPEPTSRPPPAPARQDPKARIAELQAQLQADDAIKAGGFGGAGLRMIEQRAMPMGMGTRYAAENELRQLLGQ